MKRSVDITSAVPPDRSEHCNVCRTFTQLNEETQAKGKFGCLYSSHESKQMHFNLEHKHPLMCIKHNAVF